jgi:hypothetical protein
MDPDILLIFFPPNISPHILILSQFNLFDVLSYYFFKNKMIFKTYFFFILSLSLRMGDRVSTVVKVLRIKYWGPRYTVFKVLRYKWWGPR